MAKPQEGRSRVVVEHVEPQIDCGLFPIKRTVGDLVSIEADVFGDGHDHVRARLLFKEEGASSWQSIEMLPLGNDRWRGVFPVDKIGRYRYTVVGEIDHFETWQSDLKKRLEAKQDLAVPFATGALLLEQVQPRAAAYPQVDVGVVGGAHPWDCLARAAHRSLTSSTSAPSRRRGRR